MPGPGISRKAPHSGMTTMCPYQTTLPATSCRIQQKRQQRCWKGAGLSRGIELDSNVKMGIFRAENALEATDSDPDRGPPAAFGSRTIECDNGQVCLDEALSVIWRD